MKGFDEKDESDARTNNDDVADNDFERKRRELERRVGGEKEAEKQFLIMGEEMNREDAAPVIRTIQSDRMNEQTVDASNISKGPVDLTVDPSMDLNGDVVTLPSVTEDNSATHSAIFNIDSSSNNLKVSNSSFKDEQPSLLTCALVENSNEAPVPDLPDDVSPSNKPLEPQNFTTVAPLYFLPDPAKSESLEHDPPHSESPNLIPPKSEPLKLDPLKSEPNPPPPTVAIVVEEILDSDSSVSLPPSPRRRRRSRPLRSSPTRDSDVEILSSDDEAILLKKAEDARKKKRQEKTVLDTSKNILNSIKRFKSSNGSIKIPSLNNIVKKQVVDANSKGRWAGDAVEAVEGVTNGSDPSSPWTIEESRGSTPCEDPLQPEEGDEPWEEADEGEKKEEEARPAESLTAEGVREAARKNAAINAEYNVEKILKGLKAATLTLNKISDVRSRADESAEAAESKESFCEIVIDSSDDDDVDDKADVDRKNDDDNGLEKTQVAKVAEQLNDAGVTVKKAVPKKPRQLFPKWQTVPNLPSMEDVVSENRPVTQPPPLPDHLRRPMKVLSMFDGISGCFVALRQLGISVDTYVSSETDAYSKIVTMIRHPEAVQVGDARGVDRRLLEEHGPFDLLVGGLPVDDFESRSSLKEHRPGMHFEAFVDVLNLCWKHHRKSGLLTPFYWCFYNVDLVPRHRDEITSTLGCDCVKLDAVHISPMRRPDFFWTNLPGMEMVLKPDPRWDRTVLQDCLEPARLARVRRLNTLTTSFDSMKQGSFHQPPINHEGELDDLWMVEVERVLGFPDHYTDVANLPPRDRLALLAISCSVPLVRHILAPLKDYFAVEKA